MTRPPIKVLTEADYEYDRQMRRGCDIAIGVFVAIIAGLYGVFRGLEWLIWWWFGPS